MRQTSQIRLAKILNEKLRWFLCSQVCKIAKSNPQVLAVSRALVQKNLSLSSTITQWSALALLSCYSHGKWWSFNILDDSGQAHSRVTEGWTGFGEPSS